MRFRTNELQADTKLKYTIKRNAAGAVQFQDLDPGTVARTVIPISGSSLNFSQTQAPTVAPIATTKTGTWAWTNALGGNYLQTKTVVLAAGGQQLNVTATGTGSAFRFAINFTLSCTEIAGQSKSTLLTGFGGRSTTIPDSVVSGGYPMNLSGFSYGLNTGPGATITGNFGAGWNVAAGVLIMHATCTPVGGNLNKFAGNGLYGFYAAEVATGSWGINQVETVQLTNR